MLILCAASMLLSACAKPPEARKRFFWPIGNLEPKIEYIDFYHADRDVTTGSEGGFKEVVMGREKPTPLFVRPHDVASTGSGRFYVSDVAKQQVFLIDLNQRRFETLSFKKGDDRLQKPFGLDVDSGGRLYVTDIETGKVFAFDDDGRFVRSFGKEHLTRPIAVEADSLRGRIYVVDGGEHRLSVFDLDGRHQFDIGRRGVAVGEFNGPVDVAIDPEGNLYVLDAFNARVQVFDSEGNFLRSFGERGTALGSFQIPKAIAVDTSGHVYVTDALGHRFVIFDLEGRYLLTVGGHFVLDKKGVSPGGLNMPAGIDADESDGIWVADTLNRLIHRFQYLNAEYLKSNPILPGQAFKPPSSSKP